MAVPVIMPRQGQSVETCIITRWFKNKGDVVQTGDILYAYETDKASFDAEAPAEGILLEIFATAGEEVPVLTQVAVIGKPGEPVEDFRPQPVGTSDNSHMEKIIEDPPRQTALHPIPASTAKIRISPRARILAAQKGIEPGALQGTGPNGRIIVRDVEAALSGTAPASPEQLAGKAFVGFTDSPLTHMRKLIARAMHESLSQSAQLTHHLSADARKILAIRQTIKARAEQAQGENITLNDMVCYAVIRALEKHPEMNSHFLDDTQRVFHQVHLGIAVDTPRGLMVPALQNADELSLKGLSIRLRELADQCRKGNINPELLASSAASFTVSNLGNYGVEMFTPVINLPQVGILGINTITYRPADLGNGTIGFIPVIGLSLTYDHRAVDGGPATRFLAEVKWEIENFRDN